MTPGTWTTLGGLDGEGRRLLGERLGKAWWAMAVRGLLAIAFGVMALVLPAVTMLSLVFLYAAYALVDGVFAIASAFRAMGRREHWGLLAVQGVASVIAAFIVMALPTISVAVFVLLVGAWAVVSGLLMLVAAFGFGIEHGRWWLVLSGVAALIYGGLLIAAPLMGALVLTWWLGAYAIIFGAGLIALSFRLRSLRRAASADSPGHS
jgi:uncharacterized membrane protein HdeD (DUF308 family)